MANLNDVVTNQMPTLIGAVKTASEAIQATVGAMPSGGFKRLKCEFTRPANTTPYSALDCLADNAASVTTQLLAGAGAANGGSGSIIRAEMMTDNLSWTNAIYVVIYDGSGPAAFIADNTAFDTKYADVANIVGVIMFTSFSKDATGAAGSFVKCAVDGLNMPYVCGAAVDDLYFQCFIPSGTPTPASGQKFYLNIGVLQS